MSKESLVFLPLGGSGEIGMNMNLFGFGRDDAYQWIMVDCGVTFGDLTTPGVDLITPDPSYIVEQRDGLMALVLTHGHEDHIGAVALLAAQLGCPIYATAFTAELVRRKFEERGDMPVELHEIPMDAQLEIGPFDISLVTLTHSIPEPNGLWIKTPLGNILHTGDWKIDPTPTLGPSTNENMLINAGDEGVLAMICDSTNVLSEGESGSEAGVRDQLIEVISAQKGRVAVTTFASNVSRVVSICEAAKKNDRAVCLLGRSMLRIVGIARQTGLLPAGLSFVEPRDAGHIPKEHILYLCTGSQGEPRAALARIARDDHPDISLNEGDTVIFSSKVIPGNEREIYDLQNDLVELGVSIITEKDAHIHVSGHPCRDELRTMYEWVRPHIAIPVHGEARHLEEHARFALSLGAKEALAPRNGDLIRLAPDGPLIIDETPAGRLYLDGRLLLPDGATPLRERRKMSYNGAVILSLVLDERNELETPVEACLLGVPQEGENGEDLAEQIVIEAEEGLERMKRREREDDGAVETVLRRAARKVLSFHWGKKPMISVMVHRT